MYVLSKILWSVVQPGSLIILLSCWGMLMIYVGRWRSGGGLLAIVASFCAMIALFPLGWWLILPLESRFQPLDHAPAYVDGIIMLGGEDTRLSSNTIGLGDKESSGAFVRFIKWADEYPRAKLVFAGGGRLEPSGAIREADAARVLLESLGMDTSRVIFERDSRNTYENVINAKKLARPAPNEIWILITAAFHVPRSVGIFRSQHWQVIPDPVDYLMRSGLNAPRPKIGLVANLELISTASKEWMGMVVNLCFQHSSTLFPAPSQ